MVIAKGVLALVLTLVLFMAVSALAQQALPMPELQKIAGKWSGWGTGTSGSAFPIEVQIQPDGTCSAWTTTYVSKMESTSGQGVIKLDGGKITTEGHLHGPAGTMAGTGMSQVTIATKGGKQVMSGQGRNAAGPFNYELTKE
jgi:hypothetical protein